jgi:hypothetical protein
MTAAYLNRWDDYGGADPHWACDEMREHCDRCGRVMVETIEPTGQHSRKTGEMTFARYHSCPTWVSGWRTKRWLRFWALPGYGHDSHDADNPLLARAYR